MKTLITKLLAFIKSLFAKEKEKAPYVRYKIADDKELETLEREIANLRKSFRRKSSDEIITIPVVVHVIHKGEEIGRGTNISDAQIYSAITATNEHFAKALGTDGDGVGVPSPFRIVLANKDDKGNPTTGIYRVNGAEKTALYANDGIQSNRTKPGVPESVLKSWSRQNNQHAYNIWVVSEVDGNNGGGGIQGFAYFPTTAAVDGTVNVYNALGKRHPDAITGSLNSYNLKSYTSTNKTLTHELGHAFALYHTFQPASCIDDTNPWNYMSYANEKLKNGFALCQIERMLLVAEATRRNLVNSTALELMHLIETTAELEITNPLGVICQGSNKNLEIKVTNTGDKPIHRMDIEYTINGKKEYYTWYGAIAPNSEVGNHTFALCKLPTAKTMDVEVTITNINGNTANVTAQKQILIPTEDKYIIEINQDVIAGQISWDITDSSKEVIYVSPKYPNFKPNEIITHDICLPKGKFIFTLTDVQPGFQTDGAYVRILDPNGKEIFFTDGTDFVGNTLVYEINVKERKEFKYKGGKLETFLHYAELSFNTENDDEVERYIVKIEDGNIAASFADGNGEYSGRLMKYDGVYSLEAHLKNGKILPLDKFQSKTYEMRAEVVSGNVNLGDLWMPNMKLFDERGNEIDKPLEHLPNGQYEVRFWYSDEKYMGSIFFNL